MSARHLPRHAGGPKGVTDTGRFALPGALPPGERILWQGAPGWRALARHALHLRTLAAYFALLVLSVGVAAALRHESAADVVAHTGRAALVACAPLGLGLAYAWFAARSAAYTITNRRVVLRMGVALQISLNLPFSRIDAVNLATKPGSTGDIALKLTPGARGLGWLILWPHARPWHLGTAQPMLRAIPEPGRAGQILARALAEFNDMPVVVASGPEMVDSADCQHSVTPVPA